MTEPTAKPTPKPVPNGLPVWQPWLTVRNGVMDRIFESLSRSQDPTVAALVGRSGSGKTIAAATFLHMQRGLNVSEEEGETELGTRVRPNRVQALFPDGVLWLRVGEGGGATECLPSLMRTLAQMLYEEVLGKLASDPMAVGGDSTSYIKKAVTVSDGGEGGLRCLVVADDVWEAAVVEKLRETGLWVLVTTRDDSVGFDKKVTVYELPLNEAEKLLRGAAELEKGERLPDAAQTIVKRCNHVAMDVALVGRWSTVRTGKDGISRGNQAWEDALGEIDTHADAVRREGDENGVVMGSHEVSRLSVLRAGSVYLR